MWRETIGKGMRKDRQNVWEREKTRGEKRRGEEREEKRKGGGGRGEEYSKWKVTHLKEGAVLHGTNNQRDVRCQRLHLVEAGDHLHLDI